jgi:hypothetical protein
VDESYYFLRVGFFVSFAYFLFTERKENEDLTVTLTLTNRDNKDFCLAGCASLTE